MTLEFEELGLFPQFVQAIEKLGYEHPTPIQQQAIPLLLSGHNVVGQAQTGTGKTAAFALPMLQGIEPGKGYIQALVLTPTRELAIQVTEATRQMAAHTTTRLLTVYGGQSYEVQIRQLRRGVDIVVGTPGRLIDLMERKVLDLSQVQYLVLDEADEMLEMGFIEDVETILAQVPAGRQMALFSATMPKTVRKLAERYLDNPHEIKINPTRMTVAETEQRYCKVREENKLAALTRILEIEEMKSALVFARTKARAQDLADELNQRGFPAASLHGDLNQSRREYVLNRFREGVVTLLVATDVAARGLDIEDVSHVINYDIPGDAEDYVHRIGRTGRAGKKGIAITFLTSRERSRLKEIETYTRQVVNECKVPTKEEILARRDERFVEKLTEQLGQGSISHERALIARMSEANFDLAEIAAAAIKLARVGENVNPIADFSEPVPERKSHNHSADGSQHGKKQAIRRRDRQSESIHGGKKGWESGYVRLKMNLGGAHGVRPSDVVGAIAGEVGIPGKAIGEIDIRKNFTFVDVAEKHAGQVLAESSGQYMLRGKPVLLTLAN